MPAPDAESQFRAFRHKLKRFVGSVLSQGVPVLVARAPARLDVMGGIADYSGGTVLEGTLAEAAFVGVQPRADDLLIAHSEQAQAHGWQTPVTLMLADFYAGSRLKSYAQVRKLFQGSRHWASYVLGAFHVLLREGEVRKWPHGASIVLDSSVPIGAGVASSGAIEVAAMSAILEAFGLHLDGLRMALLCQMVENHVAGVPCGVMDQVTATLGESNQLLSIKCQPCEVLGSHPLPDGYATFGIDSGVKHAIGGKQYARARVGAFMGLKIITSCLGDDALGGYLCNITPEVFRSEWWPKLPSKMRGSDFLSRYGETDDPVTTVDPHEVYSVRGCTAYPIYETARTLKFIEHLEKARVTGEERYLVAAGKLMYAAHWGYRTLVGLGARETDLIMRLVRRRGPQKGLYGAKTSGGGSGGTMAILARADAHETIAEVADEYAHQTGLRPYVFVGTSPGTVKYGLRHIEV